MISFGGCRGRRIEAATEIMLAASSFDVSELDPAPAVKIAGSMPAR
jgi:hypothetical protein